ncbi:MAG TPA: hypothetical protein VG095_02880 [Chthoniobacterales bacterium]|nr:hypothetical protein [Chthoniobacterales bacterium]
MKTSKLLVLLVAACAFLFASASEANAARYGGTPGRIVIEYSPTLGINVALAVRIDGRNAGGFTRGHTYVRYLSPGRHHIWVARNGRLYGAWERTLYVRPGRTYAFLAKHRVNEVFLQPVFR